MNMQRSRMNFGSARQSEDRPESHALVTDRSVAVSVDSVLQKFEQCPTGVALGSLRLLMSLRCECLGGRKRTLVCAEESINFALRIRLRFERHVSYDTRFRNLRFGRQTSINNRGQSSTRKRPPGVRDDQRAIGQ